MSRTIDEIYSELVSRLSARSGSSWSSLKDSLVGKELLYTGANIISMTEQVAEEVNGVVDISRYGVDRLISYAYTQDVPIDFGRPSSIRVQLLGSAASGQVCSPFQVSLSVGSQTFYNIDYCTLDEPIDLYAGSLCYTVSQSQLQLPFVFAGGQAQTWRLYLELLEGQYQSSYVKLGSDVISSSVWVFAQSAQGGVGSGPVFPYTTYNAALSDPEAKLYKVRGLWDYTTCVLFGDSNWAQRISPSEYNYEIVWLRASYQGFTPSVSNVLSVLDLAGNSTTYTLGQGFSIVSSTQGQQSSLSYARSMVTAGVFANQGLVTETQLRNYISSVPGVQSLYLSVSGDSVTAAIKPVYQTDSAFGFIEDYLYQYGVSGITYSVVLGKAIDFMLRLTAVTSQGALQLLAARSYLQQLYSYDSVTMDTRVSSASVQQALSLQSIQGVQATVFAREPVPEDTAGVLQLSGLPARGTLELTDSAGNVLGFDVDGLFKEYLSLNSSQVTQFTSGVTVSNVGDFLWFSGDGVSLLGTISGSTLLLSAASSVFPIQSGGWSFAPYSIGMYAMYSMSDGVVNLYLYNDLTTFHAGGQSIFTHPSYVTPAGGGQTFTLQSYGSTVEVLSVLGVSGSYGNPEFITCAVNYSGPSAAGEAELYQRGLARYRRGSSSSYYFDLTLMLADSSVSMVEASCYYNGVWVMPCNGESGISDNNSLAGFVVYSESAITNVNNGLNAESSWSQYATLRGLQGTTDLSGVAVYDMRIVSDTQMYILYDTAGATPVRTLAQVYYTFGTTSAGLEFRYRLVGTASFGSTGNRPNKILQASLDSLIVGQTGSSVSNIFWQGSVSTITDASYTISTGSGCKLLSEVGSVDYAQGIVYGLSDVTGSDVLSYELASVIGGEGAYPNLVGIETYAG